MSYKNILVAVDTTDEADDVLNAAVEVARSNGAKLAIVSVMKPITDFYVNLFSMMQDDPALAVQDQAEAKVRSWLGELAKRNQIDEAVIDVIIGIPATEIHRKAEQTAADLIVVGTHGQHGFQLMLGSTANAVLHGAPCDVLAVRINAAE